MLQLRITADDTYNTGLATAYRKARKRSAIHKSSGSQMNRRHDADDWSDRRYTPEQLAQLERWRLRRQQRGGWQYPDGWHVAPPTIKREVPRRPRKVPKMNLLRRLLQKVIG